MLHPETFASSATSVMLLACVVSVGFMVRFLIALTVDDRNMRTRSVRRVGVDPADLVCAEAPHRQTAFGSAAHLALGVVRITTALAARAVTANPHNKVERLRVVHLGEPRQNFDFTADPRYRSS